jgi:hypothetical protein
MAYLLNVDLGQIIVIADNLSELDRKVKEVGIHHYESVIDYVIL